MELITLKKFLQLILHPPFTMLEKIKMQNQIQQTLELDHQKEK